MLTEKDYCDYDTCIALREIGYNAPQRLISDYFGVLQEPQYDENVHLYDAQKWLREEKEIVIIVGYDTVYGTKEVLYDFVVIIKGYEIIDSERMFDSYEESLSEGIKVAVKLLKEK